MITTRKGYEDEPQALVPDATYMEWASVHSSLPMSKQPKREIAEVITRRATPREEFLDWVDHMAPWSTKWDSNTKFPCDEFRAVKLFEKFMHQELPSTTYIYFVELNPRQPIYTRGGGIKRPCHVHALTDTNWGILKEQKNVMRRDIWSRWFLKYGRLKLEPLKSRKDAMEYASKSIGNSLSYSTYREDPKQNLRRSQVAWGFAFGEGKRGRILKDRHTEYVESSGLNVKEEIITHDLFDEKSMLAS